MKHVLLFLFINLTCIMGVQAQDDLNEWDKNYRQVDLVEVLRYERQYADSVKAADGDIAYYTRIDKVRFLATYLGKKRPVNAGVMSSMKNVFRFYVGNPEQLNGLVASEYLFQVGEEQFWAPIQVQLEEPFKDEVKKGKKVRLYCLLLNERSSKGLYNSLLISEFQAQ